MKTTVLSLLIGLLFGVVVICGAVFGQNDDQPASPVYKCYVLQGPVLIVEFDGKRYVLPAGGGVIEAERSDWHGRVDRVAPQLPTIPLPSTLPFDPSKKSK